MRAAFLTSILPRVMKEGESMEGSSHFDEKLYGTVVLGLYANKKNGIFKDSILV